MYKSSQFPDKMANIINKVLANIISLNYLVAGMAKKAEGLSGSKGNDNFISINSNTSKYIKIQLAAP